MISLASKKYTFDIYYIDFLLFFLFMCYQFVILNIETEPLLLSSLKFYLIDSITTMLLNVIAVVVIVSV